MKRLFYLLMLFSSIAYAQKPKVIAHRGASSVAPENTISAFVKAAEAHADFFELDVMLSSDDSLVLMHDATLDRTTDGTGSLSSKTYAQLRLLDAGSWFSPEFTGEKIPTLREAIQVAVDDPNNIGVVIELKSSETRLAPKVVELVQQMGMESRVLISSFSLTQITQVKTLDATIAVQLFATVANSHIDQVAAINGEWVGSGGTVTQAILDYAHSKNIKVNAWTINSANQMLPLIALGIDGITTNYPSVMVAIMDDTEPSDVVLTSATAIETEVTLVWEPSADAESGITGYDIFRDETSSPTTLLVTVGNVSQYLDQTYTEAKDYYYRVKAKNLAGLSSANFSNEIMVSTLNDLTKPQIKYVTSKGDSTTVLVEFSERVGETIAETKTNYTVNNGVTVLDAKLLLDQRSVLLTTTPMIDRSFLLTVKNIKDKALTPNTMVTKSVIFLHENMSADAVAIYKLDTLLIEGTDTIVPDQTVNMNHGLAKGGVTLTEGLLGNALRFDGINGYVKFESTPSFDFGTNAVSISVWTKLDYLPTEQPYAYGPLFDSEGDQYVLYGDRGNSELRFKVVTSAGAERPGIANSDLAKGEWIHVVGVYDGANAMIYLNGVKKDSHPLTGTVKTGQVATLGLSGTSYFQGSMDQVEVYSRALTAEEVLMKFNGKQAPVALNPLNVTVLSASSDETDVSLSWSEAVNYESNIMGYEIYRDITSLPTTLVATVGNVTSFIDKTNTENQLFYYRIKAKNTRGLLSPEFSNEVSATTATDATRPVVLFSTSRGDTSNLIIEFSEKVDPSTSETVANYAIDQSVVVLDAELSLDQKKVFLTTTKLLEQSYKLTVNNIRDMAAVPNVILGNTRVIFSHEGAPSDVVAWYKFNELPIEGTDTLVVDESVNLNLGYAKNGPEVVDGFLGNAVKFDGTKKQYVQFANSPSFDINDSKVTVSVWTKLTYLPVEMPMAFGPLFDSQGDEYVLYADRGNSELRFKVVTSASAERPGIPNADLVTGQWIHVVGVYDGTSAKIYLNGVLKDSHPITGTVKTGTVPIFGVNGNIGTLSYLTGMVENVMVLKSALSESEVLDMYENYKALAINDCESYTLTEDVAVCEGETYVFPDGTSGGEAMVHVSNLKTLYGCDSTITTNLTITIVNVSVNQDQNVLTSNAAGASYRWLDCDNNNAAIPGATSAVFTATVSGNYAVEVTEKGCVAVSDCYNVIITGLNINDRKGFSIYPNPNNGQFVLEMNSAEFTNAKVEIINAQGRVVYLHKTTNSDRQTIQLPSPASGIYILRFHTESGIFKQQFIVK